jgi:secreted PhoX family phosphatase
MYLASDSSTSETRAGAKKKKKKRYKEDDIAANMNNLAEKHSYMVETSNFKPHDEPQKIIPAQRNLCD